MAAVAAARDGQHELSTGHVDVKLLPVAADGGAVIRLRNGPSSVLVETLSLRRTNPRDRAPVARRFQEIGSWASSNPTRGERGCDRHLVTRRLDDVCRARVDRRSQLRGCGSRSSRIRAACARTR
jgi:hypothetical protein